jgi:hypothetical protein
VERVYEVRRKAHQKRMMREVEMMRHTSEVLAVSVHSYHTDI